MTKVTNIARGTTEPGYWLFNLRYSPKKNAACIRSKFGNCLWLIFYKFKVWLIDGTTSIGSQLGQHVMQFAISSNFGDPVALLAWPLFGATCINYKISHHVASFVLDTNLATRWLHLFKFQIWPPGWVTCIATLPWIVLLALSVSIEFASSSARVTSVKFHQGVSVREKRTHRLDPRDTWVR